MSTQPSRFLSLLLALAIFMQMLDSTILNTALPSIAQDLNQSPLQMQAAVIAYSLTLALIMPLSGWLSDRYGTKRVFIAAMSVFMAGSLLCAVASSLPMLVFARVVQGMGGTMLAPTPRMVVMQAYDKSRLINVMNYIVMPALIGPIIGPIVGGYLVEYATWHWIFLINLPFGFIAIATAIRIMSNFKKEQNQPFDLLGFLLFGGGALGLSFAVETAQHAQAAWFSSLTALFSLCAWFGYWQHAKQHPSPLYNLQLLSVRTFRLGLISNLFCRLGMSCLPFLLPLLVQLGLGRSPSQAGWVLAPLAAASIMVKPAIKPIITRLGYRRTLVINTCLIGLLTLALTIPDAHAPLWHLLPILLLLGACNSIQFTSMNTLTLADLRPQQAGSGSSLMTVNQQLAISFGTAIGAAWLQFFAQHNPSSLHTAFRYTFWAISSMTLLSSLTFLRLHWRDGSNLVR